MQTRLTAALSIALGLLVWTGCDSRPAAKKPAPKTPPAARKVVPKVPAPVRSSPASEKPAAAISPAAKRGAPSKGKSVLDELRAEDFMIGKQIDEKEFNRMAEEVVAVVGGREIRRRNVWEVFSVPRDNDQIPPFNRRLLDQAIQSELIYQEGLRRGVDKTDAFKTQIREAQIRKWKGSVPRMAGLIEQKKLGELIRTMPPSTPSPEKVEELFASCRTYFPRETSSDEQVRTALRAFLGGQAPYIAYQKWLADLFARARVRANGKPISLEAMSNSLSAFSLAEGLRGVKAGHREAGMLYDALKGALPGDTDLTTLTLEINDDTVKLGEEPELQVILGKAREAHKERLSVTTPEEAKDFSLKLFTNVKNYLLAQQAKKEGMTVADEGPLWETPPEKMIINSLLIDTIISEEPPVEPAKEEIIAFYRLHPIYQGMDIEAAKKKIYQRLCAEKTRQAAFDRLKKRFPVRILKPQ